MMKVCLTLALALVIFVKDGQGFTRGDLKPHIIYILADDLGESIIILPFGHQKLIKLYLRIQ